MANEFKVKKGLIVDGSSTVLDVQGTQGQLFSVTDSLTGDLFSVSDVSGVPILNVNSIGVVDVDAYINIDGYINLSGTTTDYYIGGSGGGKATNELRIGSTTTTNTVALEIHHSANPVSLGIDYDGGAGLAFIESVHSSYDVNTHLLFKPGGTETWRIGSHGTASNSVFLIKPASNTYDFIVADAGGTPIITADSSARATTFAGAVTVEGGILHLGKADTASGHINAKELMTFNIDTDNDDTNRYFAWYINGESGSGTELLKIEEDGNAIFAGANTYNKIQTYYSGSYISGWKFSDYNGGIWYDAGADDLTLNAGHANSQMLLNSGGAIALTLDASQNATFSGNVGTGGLTATSVTGLSIKSQSISSQQSAIDIIQNGSGTNPIIRMGEKSTNGARLHMFDSNVEKIAFYTDGTDNHITAGKLGLGTASPQDKLHVYGTVRGDLKLEGNYTGGTTDVGKFSYAYAPRGGDSNNKNIAYISGYNTTTDSTSGGYIQMATRQTDGTLQARIRIDQDGEVGINTTNPTERLEVAGNILAKDSGVLAGVGGAKDGFIFHDLYTGSGDYYGYKAYTNNSNTRLSVVTNGDERLTVLADGKVGVGIETLHQKFSVNGNINITGGDGSFLTFNNGDANISIHNNNADSVVGRDLSFKTYKAGVGNTEKMRINRDGNVGINTSSPASMLEVHGGGSGVNDVDRYVRFKSSNNEKRFDFYIGGTGNGSRLSMFDHDGTTEGVRIQGGVGGNNHILGNLGIRTSSPGTALQVGGLDDGSNYDITLGWNAVSNQAVGTKRSALTFKTSQTGVNNEDIYKWDIAMVTAPATASSEPFGSDLAFLRSTRNSTSVNETTLKLTQLGQVGVGDSSPTLISANTYSLSVNSSRTDLSGGLITKANGSVKHQQYWDSSGYSFNLSANAGDFKWNVNGNSRMVVDKDGGLDIQGTVGQLFSVTNSLTGDLFSVSDISGIPILNINSNGTSYFDGELTVDADLNVTAGALSITSDGSNAVTLTESGSGDFTIDAPDDIRLDAGGADIVLRAGGSEYGRLSNDSQNLVVQNITSDKDIIFKGKDGISTITALTLDMSERGHASFGGGLTVSNGMVSGEIAKFSAINAHVVIESSTAGPAVLHFKPNQTGNKSGQFKVTAGNGYNFRWSNDAAGTGEVAYMDLDTSTTGGGDLTVKGDVIAYGSPSDRKYKENIKPIESALDKAMQLQGVTFDWKDSESILEIKKDIGFIAQDVQEVLPELVRDNGKGNLSLRYQGITPILLEAIKELKAEIEELKKQIK
jgi:hypothetical protein